MAIGTRSRRLWVWAGAIGALILLVAVAALVVTSRPEFCRSCHLMETRYVSWQRSTHAGKADCLDCHAEPGLWGEIKAHLNGARYLYVLVTGRPQVVLRAEVPPGTCVQCHPLRDIPDEAQGVPILHERHDATGVACEACHKGFHDEVVSGGRLTADLGVCTDCHPPAVLLGREDTSTARAEEAWSVDGVR